MTERLSNVLIKADSPVRWIDREFSFDLPVSAFTQVRQRLESMPERAQSIADLASDQILSFKDGHRWSAKEHVGHLDDLSTIDEKRLQDYLRNAPSLSLADVTNPITEAANHNAKSWVEIIEPLRHNRFHLTGRLLQLTEQDLLRSALHVRLQTHMRLIDWLWFVAEHDDHHLAAARAAIAVVKRES